MVSAQFGEVVAVDLTDVDPQRRPASATALWLPPPSRGSPRQFGAARQVGAMIDLGRIRRVKLFSPRDAPSRAGHCPGPTDARSGAGLALDARRWSSSAGFI